MSKSAWHLVRDLFPDSWYTRGYRVVPVKWVLSGSCAQKLHHDWIFLLGPCRQLISQKLLMIAFITWNNNLAHLLKGLCNSNPCRFEFSVFGVFAGSEPMTLGLTVPRSDQLSYFYIVSDKMSCYIIVSILLPCDSKSFSGGQTSV